MKVLVISGDHWHPGSVVRAGLAPLAGEACEFVFEDAPTRFDGYDVVALCKSNVASAEDETPFMDGAFADALARFVEDGGGLLCLHAGTVAPKTCHALRQLAGCAFNHHPAQCEVRYEPTGDHPLARGLRAFSGVDEHYFIDMYASDAEVFLTSRSEAGEQAAGYALARGKGRVCALTPGHNLQIWLDADYQSLLRRALEFCAGRPTRP